MEIKNGQRFDFLDRLATKNLSSYESRVLLTILKCHLVYNNGGVIISLNRICRATGLPEAHVCRALRGLIQKQILFKTSKQGLPFYSFTLPIKGLPIEAGGLPIEAIKLPIKAGVIKDSNKENNNISEDKENKKAEKQFETFFDQYPGAWNKGVEAQARKKFLSMSEVEQCRVLVALSQYKKSKSVQDKKILSPINFLNSPKIINQYANEGIKSQKKIPSAFEQQEEWRRQAEADPPKPGYSPKAEFEKLVKETAKEKSVSKKGRD